MTFTCNHYKFKSNEEYKNRLIEYNKNGYMQYKLSDNMNIEWNKNCNKMNNKIITSYLTELKKHISMPLKKINNKFYFISVLVMFRYEDDYLEEWLHYYIMHGVEHFFMYSNNNTLKTVQILEPYINNGYVTLIEWSDYILSLIPENKKRKKWNENNKYSIQNLAFIDFVKNYKNKTKWIIKVDIDEFIYPNNIELKIKDELNSSSKIYYSVPRIDFGNNNHQKKPFGLIIENYTKSEVIANESKAIALTDFISERDNGHPHSFMMK